mgnify:CR=1 FL=1
MYTLEKEQFVTASLEVRAHRRWLELVKTRPELDEARAFFEERVDPDVAAKSNAFDRALVDVLVFRSAGIRSQIW